MFKTFINALANSFPSDAVSNAEIIKDNAAWNSEKAFDKLGISQRFVSGNMPVSEMLTEAARNLFKENPTISDGIDGIIVCTQSPDYLLPTTACLVQNNLGLNKNIAAFDINLGCSGYIYGLAIAKGFIQSGMMKKILLLTGDKYTSHLAPDDVANQLIFGDGATATLLSSEPTGVALEVKNFDLGTDGSGGKNLISGRGGMAPQKDPGYLYMNGPEIFNFTIREVPELVQKNLAQNDLTSEKVSYYIFHQANKFMLESLRKKIKIPESKWLTHFEQYGNTISSTVPIVLGQALETKNIQKGESIQLVGFGVGYSWGAVVVEKN